MVHRDRFICTASHHHQAEEEMKMKKLLKSMTWSSSSGNGSAAAAAAADEEMRNLFCGGGRAITLNTFVLPFSLRGEKTKREALENCRKFEH